MPLPLWTTYEIARCCDGNIDTAAPDTPVYGVSIDSRTINRGDVFVAIKGDNFDGHDFVDNALAAGASAVIVSHGHACEGAFIRVNEPLTALEKMAGAARGRSRARVIAVTGSVGKTGSKEALKVALAETGLVHASEKSYNNHWGVPLSLARMPKNTRFGVFEVGMNHPGEITPLAKMIQPNIGIITTVEPVHLGAFSSLEEIAHAKAEIFSGLEAGGTVILNRDNSYYKLLARIATDRSLNIISFGQHAHADSKLLHTEPTDNGSQTTASISGKKIRFRLNIPGRHMVINSLAVLSAVMAANADIEAAASSLARLRAPKGRGNRTEIAGVTLIDDSYNANPASMRAALAAMAHSPHGGSQRKIAVLGDMLELGENSERLHLELLEPIEHAGIDLVFACGKYMQKLYDGLPATKRAAFAENSAKLAARLLTEVKSGDMVMVKGSLGSNMQPLFAALYDHLAQKKEK
jgi:UDP-N-acetylmuramoyl-tripeptide--D-alanyl-D-alanine ligase